MRQSSCVVPRLAVQGKSEEPQKDINISESRILRLVYKLWMLLLRFVKCYLFFQKLPFNVNIKGVLGLFSILVGALSFVHKHFVLCTCKISEGWFIFWGVLHCRVPGGCWRLLDDVRQRRAASAHGMHTFLWNSDLGVVFRDCGCMTPPVTIPQVLCVERTMYVNKLWVPRKRVI